VKRVLSPSVTRSTSQLGVYEFTEQIESISPSTSIRPSAVISLFIRALRRLFTRLPEILFRVGNDSLELARIPSSFRIGQTSRHPKIKFTGLPGVASVAARPSTFRARSREREKERSMMDVGVYIRITRKWSIGF